MSTVVEFTIDEKGLSKILQAAEKAEKVEQSRKKAQKDSLSSYDKQVSALQKEHKERQKNLKALEKSNKAIEKARLAEAKKIALLEKAKTKEQTTQAAIRKKEYTNAKSFLRGDLTPALEGMGKKGALIGAGLMAGAGLIATAGYFTKISIDAAEAKKSTSGLAKVLNNMEPGTLDKIDTLAENLNESIEKTRDRFIELRQKGLSNKEAVETIKTLADVKAAYGEATEAATLEKFFSNLSEGHKAAEALGAIREQLDVVGDGVAAAEKTGLGITDLENRWLKYKESFGEGAISLGTDIADGLLSGLESLQDFGEWAGPRFYKGLKRLNDKIIPAFMQSGKDMLAGLEKGVTDGAKAVLAKVTGIADSVTKKFKGVLGIRSPSVVFREIGEYTVEGFDLGMQKAQGPALQTAESLGEDTARAARPSPSGLAGLASSGSTGAPPGGSGLSVTIENISVPHGASPEEWSRSLRRELELMLQSLLLQRGSI